MFEPNGVTYLIEQLLEALFHWAPVEVDSHGPLLYAYVQAGGENEVLTYTSFPPEHWSRIYSTNPLERLNREVKRRTDVVGFLPNPDSGPLGAGLSQPGGL